jgi:SAM-dependent methyltransferase
MTRSLLSPPAADPALVLEILDQQYGSYVLAAAIEPFSIFDKLAERARSDEALRAELGLAPRAAAVLLTSLRAMGLIVAGPDGLLTPSDLAMEHLRTGSTFETARYLKLRGRTPEVMSLVDRLRKNTPGDYYIYRKGSPSMMDNAARCRAITLALAGVARSAAPHFVRCVSLADARVLLDVGCGSGLYSMACLQVYPRLKVVAVDHKNVLEITRELAVEHGVADRLECVAADMFADPLPGGCDAVLLSNVLHDWDVAECESLVSRCGGALAKGGQLLIHSYFLNDGLDGPLAVAMHSVALFCGARGRVYSGAENAAWLRGAGLELAGPIRPTAANMGVMAATKRH